VESERRKAPEECDVGVCWVCAGCVLGVCWVCAGCVLGVCWVCAGLCWYVLAGAAGTVCAASLGISAVC